ncbi:putative phosphatidate cytidylyltransferase-like protein [Trypanosoma theileri]|uniref:Putative phosphatidate cytidylyltransferase-like protein n=1 Tax=Trypanosoma theileri TaxID=67003 RepID=A0A1X0NT53_9TRYP|nr:putative phosphatidate cytidylyltransferase-like protein [Trypanosoma theileri]ORC87369.1 putative phosphatidate cytidylyltransferase-like protein [Trypanosoma theileri]
MSHQNGFKSSDTVKMLTSNLRMMISDGNLYIRAITIAVVGPSAVVLAGYNKYTCTLLIWFFFFFGMLEWSGLKRHIKMSLAMGLQNKGENMPFESLPKEYTTPIVPNEKFAFFTTLISSFLPIAACAGAEFFVAFLVLYFLAWCFCTLWGNGDGECIMFIFDKVMGRSKNLAVTSKKKSFKVNETESKVLQTFLYEELRLKAKREPLELFLNFCLEYFGFIWVTGVTFPLLVYDYTPVGKPWILASLVGNFSVDIVALLVGRALKGKTYPLCSSISPQKSLEGALFGIIANAVVFASILHFSCVSYVGLSLPQYYSYFVNLAFGLVLGVSGVTGDLLQSLLKRAAHVKDSGMLMPGHGGVLDRIDGLLLVFPTMYVCLRLIVGFA